MTNNAFLNKRMMTAVILIGLLLGGLLVGISLRARSAGAQDGQLTPEEARTVAESEFSGATATDVDLEREGGHLIYEVELDNGAEVEIDADSGEILEIEMEDDDDGHENEENDDDVNEAEEDEDD
jgi:uncharacterized protein YpmB